MMKRRRTTEEIRESKRRLAEEVEALKQDWREALLKGIEDGSLERDFLQKLPETKHDKPSPKH